jgi:uncharacterized alkaline shock family protein YloU
LAGTSAKNEQNRIQAVKRAIFTDDEHARDVREALGRSGIRRLLIIATSDNMINKITKRLQLDAPLKTVYISDVASKSEIKKARYSRLQEGKHIVPVPTVELKPHFTGYFADLPYNLFSGQRRQGKDGDRSIVRPSFSFYGKLLIADRAIEDIIHLIAEKLEGVERVTAIRVRRRSDNSKGIVISLEIVLYYGEQLFAVTRQLQAKIKEKVEYMTAMQVKNVDVSIRSLAVRRR